MAWWQNGGKNVEVGTGELLWYTEFLEVFRKAVSEVPTETVVWIKSILTGHSTSTVCERYIPLDIDVTDK